MIRAKVDDTHQFLIEKKDGQYTVNGQKGFFDIQKTDDHSFSILHEHRSYNVTILDYDPQIKTLQIKVNDSIHEVVLDDDQDLLLEKMGMLKKKRREIKVLKAPMPGLIVEIKVSEGQNVKKDDPLLILKAMKMENILRSPVNGVIKKILVKKNQKIEKEATIIQF
jgi:biotin carboxyl carrier protein